MKAGLGFPFPPPPFCQKRGHSYWRRQERRRKERENQPEAEEARFDVQENRKVAEKAVEKSEVNETVLVEKADFKDSTEKDESDKSNDASGQPNL